MSATEGVPNESERADRAGSEWYAVKAKDGIFQLGNLAPGRQEVSIRSAGYRPRTVDGIEVKPAESVGPIKIKLERSPVIAVAVVDFLGAPVVGAVAEIADWTFEGESVIASKARGESSGTDGRIMLNEVPTGSFTLVIHRGESRTVFPDLSAADFPRTFVIEPSGSIIGRVEGEWQRPETCVRIRVSVDRTWVGREVRPDGDGRFRIDDLAPGDYRVELLDDWSEQERLRDGHVTRFVRVRSGETTELYLDATGTGVVVGRVLSKDSGISPGRFVARAYPPSGEGVAVAEAYVDPMGTFRLDHLHEGSYRLRINSFDRGTSMSLEQDVVVRATGITGPIDFTISSGGMHGRVLQSDGSPADARVAWVSTSSGREAAAVRTDRDGAYRLLQAPDGAYYVIASSPGLADDVIGPLSFPVESGSPALEQRLAKESRLTVVVRDEDRHPVSAATINVDVSSRPLLLSRQTQDSNATGAAEFTRLPASTLTIGATKNGYVPAEPIMVGLAAEQRRTFEITLARCGSLEVTVRDERSQLFAGAEVSIAPSNGDSHGDSARRSKTNLRGVARFSALRPGNYTITAEGSGGATVDVASGATATQEIIAHR
jgi:hypothetical protein